MTRASRALAQTPAGEAVRNAVIAAMPGTTTEIAAKAGLYRGTALFHIRQMLKLGQIVVVRKVESKGNPANVYEHVGAKPVKRLAVFTPYKTIWQGGQHPCAVRNSVFA